MGRAALVLVLCLGIANLSTGEISNNVDDVKFYYYPTPETKQEIIYQDPSSLGGLTAGPTTFLIDGFLSDSTSPMNQNLKSSALKKSLSQNVIVVDWGKLSGSGLTLEGEAAVAAAYLQVLGNVGPVGERVADFIYFLNQNLGIDPAQIHIIGHSLGAHIGGAAGVHSKEKYDFMLGRITGLDPAGPFFQDQNDTRLRLHRGDATFVDIYHTNRGDLGDSAHKTANINVYVNGGDNQPGCEEADESGFKGYCSHSYSWKLYDLTYTTEIEACPCSGLPCQCKENCNTQCSDPILLGDKVTPPAAEHTAYHVTIDDPIY